MADKDKSALTGRRILLSVPFTRYFAGTLASDSGATLTGFLISIIAVVTFGANAAEMGLLVVFRQIPVVLLSLLAGVFIDRVSVRVLMIGASTTLCGLLLVAPPVLGLPGTGIAALYLFAFVIGGCMLFMDIGLSTLLPFIVPRSDLVQANSRLSISRSGVSALMPVFGGAIIRAVQPIFGLFAGAMFYAVAAISYAFISEPEGRNARKNPLTVRAVIRDIKEGLKVLFEVRVLRSVISSSAAGAFGFGIWSALFILLLARTFSLEPFAIGLVVALVSLANVFGSLICPWISNRLGPGRTLILGNMISTLGILVVAFGAGQTVLPAVVAGAGLMGAATPLYSINQISIRQAITPSEVMGRANASRRFIVFSFLPLGALAGGSTANVFGLAAGFALAAAAMFVATLIPFLSPLRSPHFALGEPLG